jgi:hypothetical protein
MDYGVLNSVIGRKVGESFWGTRLEHIIGVAIALAVSLNGFSVTDVTLFVKEMN